MSAKDAEQLSSKERMTVFLHALMIKLILANVYETFFQWTEHMNPPLMHQ